MLSVAIAHANANHIRKTKRLVIENPQEELSSCGAPSFDGGLRRSTFGQHLLHPLEVAQVLPGQGRLLFVR